MSKALANEFEFYVKHQDDLVAEYDGRFIVLKDGEVLGAYDDPATAVEETVKQHDLGTFLVQKVGRGPESYTQVFRSRVTVGN